MNNDIVVLQSVYSVSGWSAKDDAETIAVAISAVINGGYDANFINREESNILTDGVEFGSISGMYVYSFDYPNKISMLLEWLFKQ